MSLPLTLAIIALSAAALVVLVALTRHLGQRLGWSAEVQRKCVHVAVGLHALVLPLQFDAKWPVVTLILIALALMLVLRTTALRTNGIGAAIHSVERASWGDIWLALAIGFVFLRAQDSYILYALPIAIIALSDAAAALTGTSYGRRRFETEGGVKSVEGIVAFFMVSWIVAMVMLLLLTEVPRLNVVVLSLVIAVFGAVVEAVSWRGLDNLFVPISIHFFLAGYLQAEPQVIVPLAAGFFAAMLAVVVVTPGIGLGAHASRAFVIAIFLFLGVSGLYGTILPIAVMALHLAARHLSPCRSAHGDLDFIATLCAVGLIWFFVGDMADRSAINFYNLNLTGILLGYALIALRLDWRWAVPLLAAAFGLYVALIGIGPAYALWFPWLATMAAVSLSVTAIGLFVGKGWTDRWRAPRLAALAAAIPMATYLTLVATR